MPFGGAIDAHTTPSNLNVRLPTNDVSIPELLGLAALFGGGNASSANEVKGDLTADLTLTGPMNQFRGSGTLSSNTLQAQEFEKLRARGTLDRGVVQLAPVTSNVFGGSENGTVTVDTKPAHPLCSVKMNFSGVDTNALLSAVSSMKNRLYGSMAADTNVSFTLAPDAKFERPVFGNTHLGFTVLAGAKGLQTVQHKDASHIDQFSLISSVPLSATFIAARRVAGHALATSLRNIGRQPWATLF